jgi:arylsulfatase A-like enzyme/tetratricopeptide (TPR) repeat protein
MPRRLTPAQIRLRKYRKTALQALAVIGVLLVIWWWVRGPSFRLEQREDRNILLITIDTLRADALGAYGSRAGATPVLDRLAAGGVRFDSARAHNVVTLPSHANILTGRLPTLHGVHDNAGFRLPESEETLATKLKSRSFRTGAFISAFPLDSRFGLARGFDVYDDAFVDAAPRPAFLEQERPGVQTVAAATKWIKDNAGRPWFCWVHIYEPHFPYAPPEPFASRFASDPYMGDVAAADAALAPLLQPVLDAGSSTDTLVIATADHGESLGEHGEATHGIFAYESTLRVPLILYYPPLLRPSVVTAAVTHIDIMPTILEALAIPEVPELRGRGLIGVSQDPSARRTDDQTYFEALSGSLNRGWAPLYGVITNGLKFIDLPIPELYDLRDDPGEIRNLAPSRSDDVMRLRMTLGVFKVAGVPRRVDETAEVKERLRSLGYVTATTPAPKKQYTAADDPKRLIGLEAKFQQVATSYYSGNLRDALVQSRALVADRPDMRVALLQLAHLEREAGNLPGGIAALRRALALNGGDTEAASLLGAYLTAANQQAEAIELLRPYLKDKTVDVQLLVALALAEARAGRFADARATLERARAQDPSNAMLLVSAGTVELMAGRRPEARKSFEDAIAINPDIARAHSSLAAVAVDEGRTDEALRHWRRAVSLDPSEYERALAVAISLARSGRVDQARALFQFFVDGAPPARYGPDVAKVRNWLDANRQPAIRNPQ